MDGRKKEGMREKSDDRTTKREKSGLLAKSGITVSVRTKRWCRKRRRRRSIDAPQKTWRREEKLRSCTI